MKILKSALLAAGLAALAACGGGDEAAVNAPAEDVSNVAADDLGADENLLGNESLGNEADANAADDSAGNDAGNSQ